MKGPVFIVVAMALFALLDANSKLLSVRYPVDQVIMVRYATLLLTLFAARAIIPGLGGSLSTAHPLLHLTRAVVMIGSGFGFFGTCAAINSRHRTIFSARWPLAMKPK